MSQARHLRLRASLALNFCVYAIQLSSVGIAVLQVQRTFGLSPVEAGSLALFKGVGIFAGGLLGGTFAKRVGYRRTMLGALAVSILAMAVVPLLANFTAIRGVFLVAGVCYGLLKVSQYATIGLIAADRAQHAAILSQTEACYKLGSLLTFVVFTAFISDTDTVSHAWLHAYWVLSGLMAVALALLAGVRLDESAAQEPAQPGGWEPLRAMGRLLCTGLAATLALLVVAYITTENGFINWLPTFNAKVLGFAPSSAIHWAGVFAISSFVGRLGVGFVVRRLGWYLTLMLCAGASAVLVLAGLAVARLGAAPVAAALLGLTGVFVGPIFPVMHSVVLTSLPVARHNTLAGLSIVFSSTAGAVGTPLLGLVFQHYGGATAVLALLVPLAVLLGGLTLLRRLTQPLSSSVS